MIVHMILNHFCLSPVDDCFVSMAWPLYLNSQHAKNELTYETDVNQPLLVFGRVGNDVNL